LAVKKKKTYERWRESGLEVDKEAYKLAKNRSKRVVARAQDEERRRYCDILVEEDGKGNVFRVAKQMVGLNKDISGWENHSGGKDDNAKMERILRSVTK